MLSLFLMLIEIEILIFRQCSPLSNIWCKYLSNYLNGYFAVINISIRSMKTNLDSFTAYLNTLKQLNLDVNRLNTMRQRQNGRHYPHDILKCIFLNETVWISIKISLRFGLRGRSNNLPASGQIMDWRRPGDKLLSEPMMVRLLTNICVTRA